MGNIVVQLSLSLDGFMEGPDRDISWHRVDAGVHEDVNEYMAGVGAFLEGRVTFELMDGYWPTADEDPSAPAPIKQFAGIWRAKPKFVFSKTLETVADPTATIIRDVVPERIAEIKARFDSDLTLGGADLAAEFMRHDLIDGYRFYIVPVVIGAGTRLFPPGYKIDLQLTETRRFDNGVVLVRYERA